ncbi:helix-turn-helix transcriptional regulator [Variovorax paradoxus]|uniref:helix-turn-helix transcriptional regulator n=1 Tax=Variovorax paradoxus TaxID=34073 RepID=UPI00278A83C7|nr:AlpA family phage regulatory protein [Variovorax paradoxus]MDQ0590990.1 prophage regulatory protein [Variovorax paradoxus]
MSNQHHLHQPSRSVRPRDGADFLGIGLSTFWRWSRNRADFPKGIHLSPRTVTFNLDELAAWRDAQAGK